MIGVLEQEEVNGEAAQVLGDIGHDIKNLLQPIISGVWVLESEINDIFHKLPEAEATKAEASHKHCSEVIAMLRRVTDHINDRAKEIADCVKDMNTAPQFAPCRVDEVVDEVFQTLRVHAEKNQIALRTDSLEHLPTLMADRRRLFNAFYNLVHNAIPEVPAGGVVTVRGGLELAGGGVILSVEDTGRGMPLEVRKSLFTSSAISRKPNGTGLGTKIVKDAVMAHGGEIAVDSREGVGTRFTIRLPLTPRSGKFLTGFDESGI